MARLLLIFLIFCLGIEAVQGSPTLLLSAQRMKRLQRDRERQTQRWQNFENRVKSASDSPERGFELALYSVIAADEERGKEALAWRKEHPCEIRQNALIVDWMGIDSRDDPPAQKCPQSEGGIRGIRNRFFETGEFPEQDQHAVIDALQKGAYRDGEELYAAAELMSAARSKAHINLRDRAPKLLSDLPVRMLLSLSPEAVDHPDWKTHVAALALVSLDPNNDRAQFLQGWAIEDRQMLHDGPGVAYELLWADPYLPGVGYQNLDPWTFDDETGFLIARTDWNGDSCWLRIDGTGKHAHGCPAGWEQHPMTFGKMLLTPLTDKCVEITARGNQTQILSNMAAGQKLRYEQSDGKKVAGTALSTGLWRVPISASGKVCGAR